MSWHPFFRIDDGFTKGVGAVAAVARNPDHLDLFVTGNDGRIYTAWWDSATSWATWFPFDAGFTKGVSAVAAVARNPDHLDLFVTGNDGRIYTAWWDSATSWATWFPIDAGFTKATGSWTCPATWRGLRRSRAPHRKSVRADSAEGGRRRNSAGGPSRREDVCGVSRAAFATRAGLTR
jgi:hypothetical protein